MGCWQMRCDERTVMEVAKKSKSLMADALYQEGLAHAHRSEWGAAATCFKRACAIDPDSPAGESLKMVEDIQAFYHKDQFNP